jgi:hypothetical protein
MALSWALDFSQEHKNDQDNQDKPQAAGWSVAPVCAVPPVWQDSNNEQDKQDDDDGADHGNFSKLRVITNPRKTLH